MINFCRYCALRGKRSFLASTSQKRACNAVWCLGGKSAGGQNHSHYVGKEWAVVGGLNQLELTTKLPVVLTRGASTKMVISTIVDFNLFQLKKMAESTSVDFWMKQFASISS